jgi:hypothetical protein
MKKSAFIEAVTPFITLENAIECAAQTGADSGSYLWVVYNILDAIEAETTDARVYWVEDALEALLIRAEGEAKRRYDKLIADLYAVEERVIAERRAAGNFGFFYLTDESSDLENIDEDLVKGSVQYWNALYSAAAFAAGVRGDEHGFNVNAALGYVIY